MSESFSSSPGKVTGSCACRRITFETRTIAKEVTACYCRECAKVSGAGYLPFAHFSITDVKWSREPDVWKSSDFAERGHCRICGSTISMKDVLDPHDVCIVLSMIDSTEQPLPTPRKRIFLEEKADWVEIPQDNSEQFDQHKPSFQAKIDKWRSSHQSERTV